MIRDNPFVFCALDTDNLAEAQKWAKEIGPITGGLKLGLEFVNSHGPQGIEAVQNACPSAELFIDLKFHDIPNTVARAVRTICRNFDPAYLNVHAAGGPAMMRTAKEALEGHARLLGVTILTSMDEEEFAHMACKNSLTEHVLHLAALTHKTGLNGVVCSAHEIQPIRELCGPNFVLMVPGIRPKDASTADQKRVMTPEQAMQNGATHLVIGRPITGAKDPASAAERIMEDIQKNRHHKGS
ncbi:MAG: orotidine-5'-phosphate decarboxylase [Alphaproteobacteria bacterium]|nr:orotidine-5'-phosphate decarboxylase [Alphaproteobacteria bacterium]